MRFPRPLPKKIKQGHLGKSGDLVSEVSKIFGLLTKGLRRSLETQHITTKTLQQMKRDARVGIGLLSIFFKKKAVPKD